MQQTKTLTISNDDEVKDTRERERERSVINTCASLIDFLVNELNYTIQNNILKINNNIIHFDLQHNKFFVENLQGNDSNTSYDLTKQENYSIVMILIDLFKNGYQSNQIYLEKEFQAGRGHSGRLDLMITNNENQDIIMIDAKNFNEFNNNYSNPNNKSKMMQLISYVMYKPRNTKIASYYTYDFKSKRHCFNNIFCKDILEQATDSDDFYERWNKVFDNTDYITNKQPFLIQRNLKKYNDLREIQQQDTKNLFSQFLTILRLNSISDKPNAFIKMINLFLCKVADEIAQDVDFKINGIQQNGLRFQFADEIDTPESFMKRLNDLYKIGMKKYLDKSILEYSDDDIHNALQNDNNNEIINIIDNLRLKREHNFAFIEVYDDDTFLENFNVVKDVVRLLENYKFKYEAKHQFLGDFFEELLNTSCKQEAGQFFTPYPLVDFMVKSLDFDNFIKNKIQQHDEDFIPAIIDYACGAGHFLISAMSEIQQSLNTINDDNLTNEQKSRIQNAKNRPYSWVNKDKVVGIEKDYRLAKTTKIATFLNGDGDAKIISGDGINKFNSKEYEGSVLYSNDNKINKFDYVISNPPYSVDGFMQLFKRNGINKNSNTFELLTTELKEKNNEIEIYFVERTSQLLKINGYGAVVLPQSVLSQDKYVKMREFLFKNFFIKSMLLTADITFFGTTTSPVILFLQKKNDGIINLNYNTLIIMSPKYLNPNGTKLKRKEEEFLGYSFSSNRDKSGITLNITSILNNELLNINKQFITHNQYTQHENTRLVKLKDVLLNQTDNYVGDVYPKYELHKGKKLCDLCKINSRTEEHLHIKGYLEISDLQTQSPTKNKKTNRFCKKGDILISSLTPRKEQIVIAKDDFMLSNAIFVLSDFDNEEQKTKIFHALKEEQTIKQMNTLLDGFKITYAKISENNLYNNVIITL